MSRPRLLDLFCGAGGCTKGYQLSGFYVVGVDNRPQPNYCGDEFIQADALEVLRTLLAGGMVGGYRLEDFDAIHASPPCQANVRGFAALNRQLGRRVHVDLIPETRRLLREAGCPYVIENVVGASLEDPIQLCGSSFLLPLRRHRLFECSFSAMALPCNHSWQREKRYWSSFRAEGRPQNESVVVQVYGNGGGSEHWAEAMGIDWMEKRELSQAIPPAYCEHIGHFLLTEINARKAAACRGRNSKRLEQFGVALENATEQIGASDWRRVGGKDYGWAFGIPGVVVVEVWYPSGVERWTLPWSADEALGGKAA